MQDEILKYIRSKGWKHTVAGQWIRLERCPICEKKARKPFAIHSVEGTARCFHGECGWSGGLTLLKRHFGDTVTSTRSVTQRDIKIVKPPQELAVTYLDNLFSNQKVLDAFCAFRALTPETLCGFRIGLDTNGNGITYPYYVNGELVAIKYKKRNRDGSKFVFRWTEIDPTTNKPKENVTTQHSLFNVDELRGNDVVYVVEGEDDCMMLVQLGYKNVVSIPNGSSALTGAWLDPLESFHDIVIIMDNDAAGQKAAITLSETLGKYKCRIVTLPFGVMVPPGPWGKEEAEAKDITDFVRAGQKKKLIEAIDNAPITRHEKVKHVSEYADDLREEFSSSIGRSAGKTTGFPTLDGLIGGRRPGELIIMSGNTGSGKSTFALNEALEVARLGEPVLVGAFEQTISAVMKKFAQMITGKTFHLREDGSGDSMTLEDFERACDILSDLPIYFVNVYGKMATEEYIECLDYARRRLRVTFAVLDHLHFTLRVDDPNKERHEIDRSMIMLKESIKDTDVTLVVICHPAIKKVPGDDNPVIGLNDLRGSSFIQQVADLILVVWRDRNIDKLAPGIGRAVVYCLKCRSECGTEGKIELGFKLAAQKFIDALSSDIDSPVEEDHNIPFAEESIPFQEFLTGE